MQEMLAAVSWLTHFHGSGWKKMSSVNLTFVLKHDGTRFPWNLSDVSGVPFSPTEAFLCVPTSEGSRLAAEPVSTGG